MNRFQMPNFVIAPVLCLIVVVSGGCGLFETRKGPKIEETPPYMQPGVSEFGTMNYHAEQRDEMSRSTRVFRQTELEKLEMMRQEEQNDVEYERRREARVAEKKNKKSFWNWFGSGDGTSMMSNTAKDINANLEAQGRNTGLDR